MRVVLVGLVIALSASAQTVANAAGASSAIAPGSLATINYFLGQIDTALPATVSLLPAGAATALNAQVVGVSPFSITFVVPADAPVGDAEIIFKPGGGATQWARATIVPASFALFGNGSTGPAIVQNIAADGTVTLNGLASPAQPGQAIVLWGTGLGATPSSSIQVTLGGVNQQVLYAGIAPGQPGLNQINIRVASGTPDGCYVPLVVRYGAQSTTSFLSKTSDGSPCHNPFGLSVGAMKQIDSGGTLPLTAFTLTSAIVAAAADRASRHESATVTSELLSASTLANYFVSSPLRAPVGCTNSAAFSGVVESVLFAGSPPSAYSLNSPAAALSLPWNSSDAGDAPLAKLPAAVLSGNLTLLGTNPPFSFTLPAPVEFGDTSPVIMDHTQDHTVIWNGSAFDSTATALLSLSSGAAAAPLVTCIASASAGTITIPAKLLAPFSAGSEGILSISVSETGSGIPHTEVQSQGTSTLLLMNWTSTDSRPVDFK